MDLTRLFVIFCAYFSATLIAATCADFETDGVARLTTRDKKLATRFSEALGVIHFQGRFHEYYSKLLELYTTPIVNIWIVGRRTLRAWDGVEDGRHVIWLVIV